jgi:hypothetical protein
MPAVLDPPAVTDPTELALIADLDALEHLKDDWDSYGAPAPSGCALGNALRLTHYLVGIKFQPAHLAPSAEGGIVICFEKDDRFAGLECTNSGELMTVISGTQIDAHAEEVEWGNINAAIRRIKRFIDTGSVPLGAGRA